RPCPLSLHDALPIFDTALHAVLGHKLFTILRYHADTGESERVWTNRPAAYPVAGRKALNPTFWSRQVLEERRPYLGRTAADIRRSEEHTSELQSPCK